MTKTEWIDRFAVRVSELVGWSSADAVVCANNVASEMEREKRDVGTAVDWLDPEDEADVEMSYWDDGEGVTE